MFLLRALSPSEAFAQQDEFFESEGVRLRYVQMGTGEPVVLVHGVGNSVETWMQRGIPQVLAGEYRVIAYDARGHGRSAVPVEPGQYSYGIMAMDLLRLLDHLKIGRAHIVGYSMGGRVATQLLVAHSERFASLTVIASDLKFAWMPSDEEQAARELRERRVAFQQACATGSMTAECATAVRQLGNAQTRRETVLPPAVMTAVRVPILGIVGSEDPDLRPMQDFKRIRPSLPLLVVPDATHGGERGILGRAEAIAEIREFLSAPGQGGQ